MQIWLLIFSPILLIFSPNCIFLVSLRKKVAILPTLKASDSLPKLAYVLDARWHYRKWLTYFSCIFQFSRLKRIFFELQNSRKFILAPNFLQIFYESKRGHFAHCAVAKRTHDVVTVNFWGIFSPNLPVCSPILPIFSRILL